MPKFRGKTFKSKASLGRYKKYILPKYKKKTNSKSKLKIVKSLQYKGDSKRNYNNYKAIKKSKIIDHGDIAGKWRYEYKGKMYSSRNKALRGDES